jgi:hypothetical protein
MIGLLDAWMRNRDEWKMEPADRILRPGLAHRSASSYGLAANTAFNSSGVFELFEMS